MKAIYQTSYSFYNDQKEAPSFVLLSDLHFSSKIKDSVLEKVAVWTKVQKPDYILFLGDLVHCLDELNNASQNKRLTRFLERLADIAPIIAILGNHDYYRNDNERRGCWRISNPAPILNAFKDNPRITFLVNESYEDERLYLYGISPDMDYYFYDSAHGGKSTIFSPEFEDKNILIHDFKQIPNEQLHNLPKNKIKLFLCHSPVYLADKEIKPYLKDFDAYISGHMHNGVVPPAINDFWQSDRGILAPGNALLPRRTRNAIMTYKDPNIILGAIQTIQPGFNLEGLLSHAFPIYTATLTFSNNAANKRHPRKKRQYL